MLDQLRDRCSRAMDGILTDIDQLTDAEINRLIQGLGERDRNDRYIQFCTALVSVLRLYYFG